MFCWLMFFFFSVAIGGHVSFLSTSVPTSFGCLPPGALGDPHSYCGGHGDVDPTCVRKNDAWSDSAMGLKSMNHKMKLLAKIVVHKLSG